MAAARSSKPPDNNIQQVYKQLRTARAMNYTPSQEKCRWCKRRAMHRSCLVEQERNSHQESLFLSVELTKCYLSSPL